MEDLLKDWGIWAYTPNHLGIKPLDIYNAPAPDEERLTLLARMRFDARKRYGLTDEQARTFDVALIGLKKWGQSMTEKKGRDYDYFGMVEMVYVKRMPQREIAKLKSMHQPIINRHLEVARGYLQGYIECWKVERPEKAGLILSEKV